MNGFGSTAIWRSSASPITRSRSSATSSMSSCRKSDDGSSKARKPRSSRSVKAASEVYAPVSGEVAEVNEALAADPAMVNADPMGDGWFLKLRLDDPKQLDGLMDEAAYKRLVEEQH